ncbi:MAG: hypothetical protein ACQEQ4_03270 [Fibrobacterota bacterium]
MIVDNTNQKVHEWIQQYPDIGTFHDVTGRRIVSGFSTVCKHVHRAGGTKKGDTQKYWWRVKGSENVEKMSKKTGAEAPV